MRNEDLKNAGVFWKFGVFLFALLVVIDQLSKYLAHNIFQNPVFAFSLPLPVWLIYVIYLLVVAGMVYYLLNNYQSLTVSAKAAWVFIFAGAASNIGERIVLGYVRDFIYITFYKWTGVYNLADGYIIVGIILLIIKSEIRISKSETNHKI